MNITALDLSAQLRERAEFVSTLKPQNFVIDQLCSDTVWKLGLNQDPTETLDAIHVLQRLYLAGKLGLINAPEIIDALQDKRFITYKDFAILPAPESKREALAKAIYEGDPQNRQPILFLTGDYSRGLAEKILTRAVRDKASVNPWIADTLFHRRLLSICDENQALYYGDLEAEYYLTAERRLELRVNGPSVAFVDALPNEKNLLQFSRCEKVRGPKHSSMFYTVTILPTEADAERDGMTHQEFIDVFFDMCDLDWDEMSKAQKIAIAKFNAGSILRFINDDGTDVSMDITGFTFANSLVAKNVPGSEVFSAPRKDSVNGIVVAKGSFASPLNPSQLIRDIHLEFKDGKVTNYAAAENQDVLKQYLEYDDESSYTGEIGIGMNPKLRRHVTNALMVEKIGGSFHLALGHSYKYKDYMGEPVNVDNGNNSGPHWDVTTMLYGKNGKMILDGEILYENDRWVVPGMDYLNGPQ